MSSVDFFKKMLYPPLWVLILLSVVCGAALAAVFILGQEQSIVAYPVYILSFYTLSTVCIFCAAVVPRRIGTLRQKISSHPVGARLTGDIAWRTRISLYASLVINLLYVGVNVISFALYESMWFVILAVYYGLLAVMRFLLLHSVRHSAMGTDYARELRSARICSLILLALNFVLSGAVLMILYQDKGFSYGGILIYIVAMYSFYHTAHAIHSLVKYRSMGSPVMTAANVISLSAALVSLLSLETAMLTQFGTEMDAESKRMIIVLTGAGVSITVIVMSLSIAKRKSKKQGEIEYGKQSV